LTTPRLRIKYRLQLHVGGVESVLVLLRLAEATGKHLLQEEGGQLQRLEERGSRLLI
jgi:hypothetical protein